MDVAQGAYTILLNKLYSAFSSIIGNFACGTACEFLTGVRWVGVSEWDEGK